MVRSATIIFSICVISALTENIYSQDTKITLTVERATIRQIISQIERQSNYFFLFSDDLAIELDKTIDRFSVENKEIAEVMELLFRSSGLSYRITRRQVVIFRRTGNPRTERRNERLAETRQQRLNMGGIVYDEYGEALPGVNVYLKNRVFIGTTTNANGEFSIRALKDDVIVFTFVGFEPDEHLVSNENNNIIINLVPSSSQLEELIVAGLGTQRKISTVGAITTINVNDMQTPATSVANMMGGRVSGIITLLESGEPGQNISEFWIRGIGTFGASSAALVLIDGLEGNLNNVDPADIESFSILKDASATAVYGMRGANGVVLVTTKRGQTGRLKITARANYSLSYLNRMPEYLRAYDYALLANEARAVRENTPLFNDLDMLLIQNGLDHDIYPDVDWQKETIKRCSFQQTYYLSVLGGGNIARYFISLGASDEGAAYKVAPNNPNRTGVGYNTYNYRLNLDVDMTPTTSLYFGATGHLAVRTQPGFANTNSLWYAQSMLTPLTVPIMYSTGQLPAYGADNSQITPYVILNHTGIMTNKTTSSKSTLALTQDMSMLIDNLAFRIQVAYDHQSWLDERRYVLPDMYRASGRNVSGELQTVRSVEAVTAQYSAYQRQYRKYHFEGALTWDKIFENKHRVSALSYYYMSDHKDSFDADNADVGNRSLSAIPKRYQGLSMRITYGYRDTYLIDFNFGYTGSENFAPGNQFGFFPSVAIGWVPTQYEWTRNRFSWLNHLKFRASYGSVGSDRIADFRFPFMTMASEDQNVGWGSSVNGVGEIQFGADNLMWEKALKANIGIEANLFADRLSFTIEFFNDKRDGIFQRRESIPTYAGLHYSARPFGNVGKMQSYGSDGNITFANKISNNWSFTLRANYTFSQNEVINWEQAPTIFPHQKFNGYPTGRIQGYVATGLFRDEQDVVSSAVQTFGGEPVRPGDIKYRDVNGDGVINSDDMVFLSDSNFPKLMYGFGGEVKYKNLTIGVLFKGIGKTDFYHVGYNGSGAGYVPFHSGETGNVLKIAKNPTNRWIPMDYALAQGIDPTIAENPNARFPRLTHGYNANNSQLSTWWKGDCRYLRLQEVSINYRFANDFLRKANISSLDLKMVGINLYLWDKVGLWDPEQAWLNGRVYPIPSKYTLQAYLNF